ncbi:hypothetical protein L6164_007032 [Bauhinia variegata]|uniref:Uncharacterized protein n=1 Tax=Bauhinia variegata TaxID=167791 RepID=A0ACB9PVF7_BAUVA|nr:hypothetical protein L6164_007032 [Bauhinia variegata]
MITQKHSNNSSSKEEEVTAEKTTIFYLQLPCYFIEEVLRALLRCLGLENGSKQSQQEAEQNSSSSSQTTDKENNASNNQTSSQQDQDVDPPSITQDPQLMGRSRRGPRRSGLDRGQDPQVN